MVRATAWLARMVATTAPPVTSVTSLAVRLRQSSTTRICRSGLRCGREAGQCQVARSRSTA